ncbi:hypothetical protein, partial [uncultured Duncaniella sp.]|uniref:hypothetical protein n=2 Tax=uncultured Duncaniella sp. TaxID=2768039 RepID=UPI002624A051
LFINLLLFGADWRWQRVSRAFLSDSHKCNKFYAKIVDENLTRFLSKNCKISDMTKLLTCHVSNCSRGGLSIVKASIAWDWHGCFILYGCFVDAL